MCDRLLQVRDGVYSLNGVHNIAFKRYKGDETKKSQFFF